MNDNDANDDDNDANDDDNDLIDFGGLDELNCFCLEGHP